MGQPGASPALTLDDVAAIGAANELVWRAARLVSLSCEGLPLAGGPLDPVNGSRWPREQSLRAELAANLGLWKVGAYTHLQEPRQRWWTRVGYPTVAGALALLTVEVAAPTRAVRESAMDRIGQLRAATRTGVWREVEAGRGGGNAVVRATIDDRGHELDDASAWIHDCLEELIESGLVPPRRAPPAAPRSVRLTECTPRGGSVFSQMRGPDRDLAEHLRLVASLAVDITPEPLRRAPSTPDAPAAYPALRYFHTGVGALGRLPRVEVPIPGRPPAVLVEGTPLPGERSWAQLHASIIPADGAIWADLRLLLGQSGLALPRVTNLVEPGGLAAAQGVIERIAEVLASVVVEAEAPESWRWRVSRGSDSRRAVTIKMLREWAQTSRLLTSGSSGRDVYVQVGWVPRDGTLALQVAVAADPERRGLRDVLLDRCEKGGLENRGWRPSDRSWAAIAITTRGDHPQPALWIMDRVRELGVAGLLAPFTRWGVVAGEETMPLPTGRWPAPKVPDNSQQLKHLRQVEASARLATQPSPDLPASSV